MPCHFLDPEDLTGEQKRPGERDEARGSLWSGRAAGQCLPWHCREENPAAWAVSYSQGIKNFGAN